MSDGQRSADDIRPGQRVRILAGVFESFEAIVESVDTETGNVRAGIHIFGKVTPVELGKGDIKPIG